MRVLRRVGKFRPKVNSHLVFSTRNKITHLRKINLSALKRTRICFISVDIGFEKNRFFPMIRFILTISYVHRVVVRSARSHKFESIGGSRAGGYGGGIPFQISNKLKESNKTKQKNRRQSS